MSRRSACIAASIRCGPWAACNTRRRCVDAESLDAMTQDLIGVAAAPIDTTALSDEVARRFRREIFSGTGAGGQPLRQLQVAERVGVSAVPVRAGFQRLAD